MWPTFKQRHKPASDHDDSSHHSDDSYSPPSTSPPQSPISSSFTSIHVSHEHGENRDDRRSQNSTTTQSQYSSIPHRLSYEEILSNSSIVLSSLSHISGLSSSLSSLNRSDAYLFNSNNPSQPDYQSMRSSTPLHMTRHSAPLSRRSSLDSTEILTSSDRPLFMTRQQYSLVVHKLRQESRPITHDNIHQEGLIMFADYNAFYMGNI